jgi:hypothetical protein
VVILSPKKTERLLFALSCNHAEMIIYFILHL